MDPDDRTPLAIRNAADEVVTYGAPVLPGAMFMLAYKKRKNTGAEAQNIGAHSPDVAAGYSSDIPIMGLPGCVMYARRTIFDLVQPRIVPGEHQSVEDFSVLGEGGMCLNCKVCTFPNCGFG